nr:cation channel sperm-associated protein subunit delta [Macaca nemestrina]
MFKYSDHPLNRSLGLSFDYNGTLDIVIAPGQKGILLLWFEKSLLFSRNAEVPPECIQAIIMALIFTVEEHVMVSNPHSLGFQATFYESGYTSDGNTKYKLVSCIPTKPRRLSLEGPPSSSFPYQHKKLRSFQVSHRRDPDGMTGRSLTQPEEGGRRSELAGEFYDPGFQGRQSSKDLHVFYSYQQLGCPLLVYYDTPWKPVVELWKKDRFQEVVDAEYVLLEVNGQFSYSYSLTAKSAMCTSQPQNWTTMIKESGGPFFWNRENYVSCHDPNNDAPLRWPDVQYQILGGRTANQIIFSHNNGFYVFYISIVDPYYSYCQLETVFSIYVYGAFPVQLVSAGVVMVLLISSMLGSVWLAYMIPRLLRTARGRRMTSFVAQLYGRCKTVCQFRASATARTDSKPMGRHRSS